MIADVIRTEVSILCSETNVAMMIDAHLISIVALQLDTVVLFLPVQVIR